MHNICRHIKTNALRQEFPALRCGSNPSVQQGPPSTLYRLLPIPCCALHAFLTADPCSLTTKIGPAAKNVL